MKGKHTFEVTVYDDYADDPPRFAEIDFTQSLRNTIRRHMAIANMIKGKEFGFQISSFIGCIEWLDGDKKESECKIETTLLCVDHNSICWDGRIKYTDIEIKTGEMVISSPERQALFFEEGDTTEAEAIDSVCLDMMKLKSNSKLQLAVNMAALESGVLADESQ